MNSPTAQAQAFNDPRLIKFITKVDLADATRSAEERQIALGHILHYEYNIPRQVLLDALEGYYKCTAVEFDERLPISPELLTNLSKAKILSEGWFPIIKKMDGGVIVAAVDPADSDLTAMVTEALGAGSYEFRVILPDDIVWFVQDFLNAPPGELIGTERTGLAFWRNTMALWRTRMDCYRADLAKARTALALGRAGIALVIVADTLWRSDILRIDSVLSIGIPSLGILLILIGAPIYLKVRHSHMKPPRDQTLMEVTAAIFTALENFHFPELDHIPIKACKNCMLARLGDILADYCTIIYPDPASRERTHLARERNVLAAQRTLAACYRTIYSRARTGLAFIRTGVYFISISIGLLSYFRREGNIPFDFIVMAIGLLMIVDGLFWYLPVRREQAELPNKRAIIFES